jgi:hypothetical protein
LPAQEASTPLNNLNVIQVVTTTPAIDFQVTAASVSANGHQLLLVGSSHAVSTLSTRGCCRNICLQSSSQRVAVRAALTVLIATAHAAVFASAGLITHPAKFLLFTSLITQAISIYCRSLTDKMLKQ